MAPSPGLKVALVGDQGIESSGLEIFDLIASENSDMAIILGDLGYAEEDPLSPTNWEAAVTAALGVDFPLFALIGNHDVDQWSAYDTILQSRLDRISNAACEGELGVKSVCRYEGTIPNRFVRLRHSGVAREAAIRPV